MIAAYLICAFVVLLYATIIYGSVSESWGNDFTPTLRHWSMIITRGVEAILDTTFLSAMATPFAALLGMVVAWLVVRKNFSGKEILDFSSNLGGAIPGTILGIGFVMAFNKPPLALSMVIYGVLALFFVMVVGKNVWERLVILLLATATGILLSKMGAKNLFYLLGWLYILVGLLIYVYKKKVLATSLAMLLGVYVMSTNWATIISQPIANFSRGIERGFWSNAIFQLADHIKVIVQPPPSLLAIFLVFYVEGFTRAVTEPVEMICQMDAAFSHDPALLPALVDAAQSYDLVIGSRYTGCGRVVNWPFDRAALSTLANWYIRVALGLPVRDSTAGFRCWRREALSRIPLASIESDGYAFQIEMAWMAWRHRLRITEVPISFVERRLGQSKMSWAIVMEAFGLPWRLRRRRW